MEREITRQRVEDITALIGRVVDAEAFRFVKVETLFDETEGGPLAKGFFYRNSFRIVIIINEKMVEVLGTEVLYKKLLKIIIHELYHMSLYFRRLEAPIEADLENAVIGLTNNFLTDNSLWLKNITGIDLSEDVTNMKSELMIPIEEHSIAKNLLRLLIKNDILIQENYKINYSIDGVLQCSIVGSIYEDAAISIANIDYIVESVIFAENNYGKSTIEALNGDMVTIVNVNIALGGSWYGGQN